MENATWLHGQSQATSRPTLRKNLSWCKHTGKYRDWWILTDPVSNQHYRCENFEARVLQCLDGSMELQEVQKRVAREIVASDCTMDKIQSVVRFATANRLLLAQDGSLQQSISPSNSMPSRAQSHYLASLRGTLLSMVYQRIRLGNPNAIAHWAAPKADFLFGPTAVRFWIAVIAVSWIAFALNVCRVDYGAWMGSLQLSSIRDWKLWFGCLVIFVLTRILHEAAHAVVCARNGASCPETGLMRILLIAFPYVNVTDAWRIADRRARLFVFAAGVYLEQTVASIAIWIWMASLPGFIHDIALATIAMCAATSLLFNANPLMKYDGYYILSDWLEVADLQKSSRRVWRDAVQGILKDPNHKSPLPQPDRRTWLSIGLQAYLPFSAAYRVFLAFGMLVGLLLTFHAWHLTEIGWTTTSLLLFLGAAVSLDKKLQSQPPSIQATTTNIPNNVSTSGKVRLLMRGFVWLIAMAGLGIAMTIPLPQRIHALGRIISEGRSAVFASTPATILTSFNKQDSVEIQLNRNIADRELMRVRQSIEETEAKRKIMQQAAFFEPSIFDQLPQLKTIQALRQTRYETLERQFDAYRITVDPDQLFLPTGLSNRTTQDSGFEQGQAFAAKLHQFTRINSPHAIGLRIDQGTLLGYGCPKTRKPIIEVMIPQADRAAIYPGQRAKVRVQQSPFETRSASVIRISQLIQDPSPRGDNLATSSPVQDTTHYEVQLAMEDADEDFQFVENGNAEVVFQARGKSLLHCGMDYLSRLTR